MFQGCLCFPHLSLHMEETQLELCFSKHGPWTSSITWELLEVQVLSSTQTSWIPNAGGRIQQSVFTSLPSEVTSGKLLYYWALFLASLQHSLPYNLGWRNSTKCAQKSPFQFCCCCCCRFTFLFRFSVPKGYMHSNMLINEQSNKSKLSPMVGSGGAQHYLWWRINLSNLVLQN